MRSTPATPSTRSLYICMCRVQGEAGAPWDEGCTATTQLGVNDRQTDLYPGTRGPRLRGACSKINRLEEHGRVVRVTKMNNEVCLL